MISHASYPFLREGVSEPRHFVSRCPVLRVMFEVPSKTKAQVGDERKISE
jgi:hypothetical protein